MFKIKNVVMALVFSCVILFTIPQIAASTVQFDNSEFVSELTSEEIEEIEEQKKLDDYNAYQAQIDTRISYKNFAEIPFFEDEEAFENKLQTTYDSMSKNTVYNEEQKNVYYNLVIGSKMEPGILYKFYDFSNLMKSYNDNDDVVVDTTAALQMINERGFPKIDINNEVYISQLSQLITDISASFVVLDIATTPEEELLHAKRSNIIFSNTVNAMLKQFNYFSMPKMSILARLTNTEVVMNLGLLAAIIILFLVRFPVVKKQQEYAWDEFKPLSLLVIPVIGIVVFVFFSWFLDPNYAVTDPEYKIYVNGDSATTTDRIYLDKTGLYEVSLVAPGSDLTVSSKTFSILVSDDDSVSAPTTSDSEWVLDGRGALSFTSDNQPDQVYKSTEDPYEYITVNDVVMKSGISVKDNFEPDEKTLNAYIETYRDQFILPMKLRLIIPSLLFGTLYFMFLLMPKPMVKTYLNELYTINKFCGFLSYNMAYRSNARVLIEETLQSLDSCKFAEDFAIIFFEKDRSMTDKIQDISQIYSYKFFEMYLGIVNIIFDEGVSDSTLKSLSIIQQFGDEYYNQADMFFKSKNGAITALKMIIMICVAIPLVVKTQLGYLFALFLCTPDGYTATIGCYLVWFGILCMIMNMYKDNKIVRAEGRYV